MRFTSRLAALIFLVMAFLRETGAAPTLTGFPFTDEDLNYSVNWPSGLNLGEGHLHARHSGENWNFELSLDASVPGFAVKDTYSSVSGAGFCSTSFDRKTSHGSRATGEKETVDPARATATRVTQQGGGTSEIAVPACVKDALTFLFFARRELGQGRVPPAQSILMGGLYQVRLDYAGAQSVQVNDRPEPSDKVVCTVKAASSEFRFEMYFARDAARTPLLIKVPFAMGTFSMELMR
jgi:hypothetical protein